MRYSSSKIKKIKISNFKSFKEETIELDSFNVIIGSNASGKSNLISIFKFIDDIIHLGLENAISMQSGEEYITNINIGNEKPLSIELSFDLMSHPISSLEPFFHNNDNDEDIVGKDLEIKFSIDFTEKPYRIIKDIVTITLDVQKNDSIVDTGQIIFESKNGKIIVDSTVEQIKLNTRMLQMMTRYRNTNKSSLLLENRFLALLDFFMISPINFRIFDFDPKLLKRASPITGKIQLNSNGSNLAIVLKRIMARPGTSRFFYDILSTALPFIKHITSENFIDKSILLKISEVYNEKNYLPASLISDGTANVTALITALFFEISSTTIIEEPERNIHPSLLTDIVSLMQEASKNTQVIITTHNPEMVKQAGTKNLILIHRGNDGFSKIIKPKDSIRVQEFLKNEMDLADLYIQNLLN